MWKNSLLAALGGAVGTFMRFGVYVLFKPSGFPAATLLINIAGSLLIGLVFGFGMRGSGLDNQWKIFLATGICGGFTTFSAFSLENMELLREGKYSVSILYITVSILGGIAAAWLGYKVANS